MGLLDHRHALITGGGTGIGASIARVLAGVGASVSIAGRRKTPLDEVAAITPDKVAQTVLWLCSPAAASINGQAIAITGGPTCP